MTKIIVLRLVLAPPVCFARTSCNLPSPRLAAEEKYFPIGLPLTLLVVRRVSFALRRCCPRVQSSDVPPYAQVLDSSGAEVMGFMGNGDGPWWLYRARVALIAQVGGRGKMRGRDGTKGKKSNCFFCLSCPRRRMQADALCAF